MALFTRILRALIPLVLATIAIAFAIAATTSKKWAIRHQYKAFSEAEWTKATLDYTEYRSPFVVCGITSSGYKCNSYPPFGHGKTSCESWNALGSGTSARYGDERLCQEVHWAGNLAIASTTFVGIAFLLTIGMSVLVAVAPGLFQIHQQSHRDRHHHHHHHPKGEDGAAANEAGQRSDGKHRSFMSKAIPWINGILIFFFVTGAILYGFAQLYGLLAFTQSIPDNGVYSSGGASGSSNNPNPEAAQHGPWIQGKALSVYGSVAWFAAALAALAASLLWMPRVTSSRD